MYRKFEYYRVHRYNVWEMETTIAILDLGKQHLTNLFILTFGPFKTAVPRWLNSFLRSPVISN